VRRIEVEKYAHPKVPEMGVVSAKLPARIITGGLLDESLIAQIMVAKFDDYLRSIASAPGETRKMRLWTYLSSAGADPPIILYHFTTRLPIRLPVSADID